MTSLSFRLRNRMTIKKERYYALYDGVCHISSKPSFKLVMKSRSYILQLGGSVVGGTNHRASAKERWSPLGK